MEIVNTVGSWGIKAFAFAGMLLIGYMYLKKISKTEKKETKAGEEANKPPLHIKL